MNLQHPNAPLPSTMFPRLYFSEPSVDPQFIEHMTPWYIENNHTGTELILVAHSHFRCDSLCESLSNMCSVQDTQTTASRFASASANTPKTMVLPVHRFFQTQPAKLEWIDLDSGNH